MNTEYAAIANRKVTKLLPVHLFVFVKHFATLHVDKVCEITAFIMQHFNNIMPLIQFIA